jgi:hypothetical protein
MVSSVKNILVFAAAVLGSCTVPPPGADREGPPSELAGRVAGPARRCVSMTQTENLRISQNNRHTLVYGSGRTIWANNLGECRFGSDDVLVTEPFGSSFCRGDIVRSFDRISRIPGPACVLSDFVPFTR